MIQGNFFINETISVVRKYNVLSELQDFPFPFFISNRKIVLQMMGDFLKTQEKESFTSFPLALI